MHRISIFEKTVYVTLIFTILCFDWSMQDKVHVHIPAPVALFIRQISEMCSKETGVPVGMMKQIMTVGPIPDDELFKKYLYCVSYKSGYTDIDGHFVIEKIANFQTMNGTKEDFLNSIKNCNKINLGNHLDTVHEMAHCVQKDYFYTV